MYFIFFFNYCSSFFFFFFFQAEDGIRDTSVTGVQTCALPILLAPLEEVLERDPPRDRRVIEEERELEPARAPPAVGAARVHVVVDLLPRLHAQRTHAPRLVRRQNREPESGVGEHLERLVVDGRLRQPAALGLAAEARPEVLDAPPDLRHLVAAERQRHDHMVVDLGDGVAVAAPRGRARPVRRDDLGVDVGPVAVEPGQECGTRVERDLFEVVDDVEDAILAVHAPRGRVGRVALGGDPLVPVVERRCRVLHLDGFEPGVLAGRLVEVAVDDDRAGQNSSRPRRKSRRPPRGTTTSPDRSTSNRRPSRTGSIPISVSAGMMLKRSTIARRRCAPLPTVVWSMTIESSMTAPSFTQTLRPRIELRMVARLTSDASPIWALSTSPPMNRAAGPG